MTPGVSSTVVVKGFQGTAAIKQRPLKRGNTGSRVSGFTVSCHVAPTVVIKGFQGMAAIK
jgi:hypothetical protein